MESALSQEPKILLPPQAPIAAYGSPLASSMAMLVQTLSARFMQAQPHEESANLAWVCEQLGITLEAEVVAIRDLAPGNLTTPTAAWTRCADLQSYLELPLPIRGTTLPAHTVVAFHTSEMPICPPEEASQEWAGENTGGSGLPCTLFCPLLDGGSSTGFLCVVLPPGVDASSTLVALMSSVSAVISQFRKRVAVERRLRQQMDLTALQGRIAELFAEARSVDAERVLVDVMRSLGEHLGAVSLSLWWLDVETLDLTRELRWLAESEESHDEGRATVELSVGSPSFVDDRRGPSWPGVERFAPELLARNRDIGGLGASPGAPEPELWSVPIVVNGLPQGCIVIGLLPGRGLCEWEAVGLRSIAALIPVIKSRFAAEDQLTTALMQQAHFDELTGLPNRHGFAEIVARSETHDEIAGGQAHLAMVMIDINEFKSVNDRLGHRAGDVVLQEVTNRLQSSIRGSDRAVRYGGDEFVILLDGPLNAEDALRIATHLHEPMAEPVMVEGEELLITLSIGVTLIWGELSVEFTDGLHRADIAMYRAKDRGPGSTEMVAGGPVPAEVD